MNALLVVQSSTIASFDATAEQLLEDLRSFCVDNKLWISSMSMSTDSTGMADKVVVFVLGPSEADEIVERVNKLDKGDSCVAGQLVCAIVGAAIAGAGYYCSWAARKCHCGSGREKKN